jgi:hypothetical protein
MKHPLRTRYIPSVTTHGSSRSSWRTKLQELVRYDIQQCGIFVTGIKPADFKEFADTLIRVKKRHFFTVPFVHAVSSMAEEHYQFFQDEFNTEWFNLHPVAEYPLEHTLSDKIRSRILIENSKFTRGLSFKDCEGFAGLCIDLSHLEDSRINNLVAYTQTARLADFLSVPANHISGILTVSQESHDGIPSYADHNADRPENFDYVHELPEEVRAPLAALELEIPLREQLKIVSYLEERDLVVRLQQRKIAA